MTDPKLAELDPQFRPKAAAVLADLKGKGWNVFIAEGRRTITQQAQKVAAGFSHTMKSKHIDGLAADIVPHPYGWNIPLAKKIRYIAHMRSTCKAHGLVSGSLWKSFGKWGDWAHTQLGK